jgi:hypothetical protein
MPTLMDLLNASGSPLVPKRAIQGLQDALAPGSSAPLPEADPNFFLSALGLDGIQQLPEALPDILGGAMNHPMESARGFASGALEGARGLTSPASLAGIMTALAPAVKGLSMGGRLGGVADDATRMGQQTLDVVDDLPTPQIKPSMGDVDAVIGDSMRQQARVPNATGRYRHPSGNPVDGLAAARSSNTAAASLPPEFVPRGGEAAFNAGRRRGAY